MCQLVLKVNAHFCVCFYSFFAVDAPISLEQCFAATGLLVSSIQQTLACSVGLIKAPLSVPSREVALSPTGKPDDDKVQCLTNTTGQMKHKDGGKPEDDNVQCLVNTTGRMKHKDGSSCDTMVARGKFNVALASVLKSTIRDVKFTDGSGRKLVCTQVELKGLCQLLGIVHFLLRSGSCKANTIPVEGGKSCLVDRGTSSQRLCLKMCINYKM